MDSLIVTIVGEDPQFTVDMDLPSKQAICDLLHQITELLEREFSALSLSNMVFRKKNGPYLKMDQTLEDAGVFDGDILILEPA